MLYFCLDVQCNTIGQVIEQVIWCSGILIQSSFVAGIAVIIIVLSRVVRMLRFVSTQVANAAFNTSLTWSTWKITGRLQSLQGP